MVSTVDLLFALAQDSTATDLQFVQESAPRQLSSTCGLPQRLLLHTRFSCDLFDQNGTFSPFFGIEPLSLAFLLLLDSPVFPSAPLAPHEPFPLWRHSRGGGPR